MTLLGERATAEITDRIIDGPHGPLRLRLYAPPRPAGVGLVWLHGGGFASGDLDQPEAHWVANRLADAGVSVISVDYQLAPQRDWCDDENLRTPGVHFPIASEEVSAAFDWADAKAELGVPEGGWCLGGGSAGANLAAGAALRLRDADRAQPRSLVLAYPVMHAEHPPHRPELAAKLATLAPEDRFSPEMVRAMNVNYVGEPELLREPYAFPGGTDLEGLPPTFVLTSDFDGLRSSGEQFASELAAAGVDVLLVREDGTRHGHLNDPDDPGAHRSVARMAAWLLPNPLLATAPDRSGVSRP